MKIAKIAKVFEKNERKSQYQFNKEYQLIRHTSNIFSYHFFFQKGKRWEVERIDKDMESWYPDS